VKFVHLARILWLGFLRWFLPSLALLHLCVGHFFDVRLSEDVMHLALPGFLSIQRVLQVLLNLSVIFLSLLHLLHFFLLNQLVPVIHRFHVVGTAQIELGSVVPSHLLLVPLFLSHEVLIPLDGGLSLLFELESLPLLVGQVLAVRAYVAARVQVLASINLSETKAFLLGRRLLHGFLVDLPLDLRLILGALLWVLLHI